MQPSDKPSKKRPIWRYFTAPMLVFSVGLHGALLLLPTGASDNNLVPPPDPEEDGIAITRIEPPTAEASNSRNSSSSSGSNVSSSASASGNRGNRSTDPSRSSSNARSSRESNPASSNSAASRSASNSENSLNLSRDTSTDFQSTASDPLLVVLDYFAVFETYRGPFPVADEEIHELKESWLSGLKEESAQLSNINVGDIQPLTGLEKIPYPAEICLPEVPTTAQLLVLVDSEGIPNQDIFPIKDTGYTSFDDQAGAVIRAHTFPEQESPVAYLVNVEVAYDPESCEWPPEVEGVPNAFWTLLKGYMGPALTNPNDAKAEEERWRSQRSLPEATPLPDFEATVSYDLALCLPIAPGPAQFGVVIEPDGTFRDEPQLLRSTGYRRFNNQAEELLNLFTFSSGDTPQVHVLTVSVDYNPLLCESLSAQAP
ncbi:MAG: hypothetical protein ACFB0C_13675 [Leptolyngbyaceae cyanobacterium]